MSTTPVVFSASDLLASNELEPGWYPIKVESVNSKPGKSDPNSITWEMNYVVASGPKAGTPIKDYFSSKLISRAVGYIKCFEAPTPGKPYDLATTVGKVIEAWCFFEDDGQFRNNRIKEYRKLQS